MNRLALLLSLSIPALLAQNPNYKVKHYPAPEETLTRLKRELKGGRGQLLIRPAGDDGFARRLGALLKQAPLSEMDLPTKTLVAGTRLDRELAENLRLEPGPSWLLVDAELHLLCQGREVPPRPEAMGASLQAAGWQTRRERLTAFLARYPDHLEAQAQRVQDLGGRVGARLKPLLSEAPPNTLRRPLTAAEDERIFGAYARALEAFLRDAASPTTSLWLPDAAHEQPSALLRDVAKRCRPMVEARLRRQPGSFSLWGLWSHLETLFPSLDALAFITSIPQVEGDAFTLQSYILPPLRRSALATGRWADLLPLALQAWASDSSPNTFRSVMPDFRATWDSGAGLAVECLLRLHRTAEATRVLQEFLAWSDHSGAAAWAATQAKEQGHPEAARHWASLRPPAGAGGLISGLPEASKGWSGNSSVSRSGASDDGPLSYLLANGRDIHLFRFEPAEVPNWDDKGRRILSPASPERQARERTWSDLSDALVRREFSLRPERLRPESVAGGELRAQEGWGPEPRWVLLDRKGKVLEHGTVAPTAESLEALLRRHGHSPRHERVEALLKAYPDHVEGLREHFRIHLERAQRSIQRQESFRREREDWEQAVRKQRELAEFWTPASTEARLTALRQSLGPEAERKARAWIALALKRPLPEPPATATPEDPEAEWEEAARLLSQLLEQPDWADPHRWSPEYVPEAAYASPAFQRVAPALQEQVEALLLRNGRNQQAWQIWMDLSGLTGASPLELLERVPRVPDSPRWGDHGLQNLVVTALTRQKRWEAMAEWVTPLWEAWVEEGEEPRSPIFPGFKDVILAELMLLRPDRAEAWVEKQLLAATGLQDHVLREAAGIAEKAGQKELAKAWHIRAEAIVKAPLANR